MIFEEVYGVLQERRLTQEEVARMLGVCQRAFRRQVDRYEESGLAGLMDKRLSQGSHRRAPVDEVLGLVEQYKLRHEGWNAKHFYAWYSRDGGKRSYTWVKCRLQEAGGKVDKVNLTQFGGAMKRLGIGMIPAYSPEARGRCERMFGTHQDRLPKELALAGTMDMEAANRYVNEVYLPAFNAEFMQPAMEEGSAFVAYIGTYLDDILCEQHERIVGKDNCVSFEGLKLKIPADQHRFHYVKVTVRVHRYQDGTLAVFHGPRRLACSSPQGEMKEIKATEKRIVPSVGVNP